MLPAASRHMASPPLLLHLSRARALGRAAATRAGLRRFRLAQTAWTPSKDSSIPFARDSEALLARQSADPGKRSSITPHEASVFKDIFQEIALDRLPRARRGASRNPASEGATQSIFEQVGVPGLREDVLMRYPPALRDAAMEALSMYQLQPAANARHQEARELDELEAKRRLKICAQNNRMRQAERSRIASLFEGCDSDVALWKVMEDEIFSLPKDLGILRSSKTGPATRRAAKSTKAQILEPANPQDQEASAAVRETSNSREKSMDVHGPLYPMFLRMGLLRFDRFFSRSSPFAFQILPRIKEMGLLSYVLGVSTPFYAHLASMYWYRFGDAAAALALLREMNDAGLQTDDSVDDLLDQIRGDLDKCVGGDCGLFAKAIAQSPPYGGGLTQRLTALQGDVGRTLEELAAMKEVSPHDV